jgi:hypothetical protein
VCVCVCVIRLDNTGSLSFLQPRFFRCMESLLPSQRPVTPAVLRQRIKDTSCKCENMWTEVGNPSLRNSQTVNWSANRWDFECHRREQQQQTDGPPGGPWPAGFVSARAPSVPEHTSNSSALKNVAVFRYSSLNSRRDKFWGVFTFYYWITTPSSLKMNTIERARWAANRFFTPQSVVLNLCSTAWPYL